MLKFLGFGRTKPVAAADSRPSAMANDTMQHTSIQRELVRVVLKDTLRITGIPPGTIGCEVGVMSRQSASDELVVNLIILKWNEAVLRYAPVIQHELIRNLDRFDPEVDHTSYKFSWRFAAECECPFKSMPDPEFWNTKAEAAQLGPVAVAPPAPTKPKFDLPPSDRDNMPSDFAPTQPNPMN
ncbi:MAG: hypothetical protein RL211_1303 [Pseudomonadota bacterium]|jgi:hypothetical protein